MRIRRKLQIAFVGILALKIVFVVEGRVGVTDARQTLRVVKDLLGIAHGIHSGRGFALIVIVIVNSGLARGGR